MTTVYILVDWGFYCESTIYGVFSSLADAETAKQRIVDGKTVESLRRDAEVSLDIVEYTVGELIDRY